RGAEVERAAGHVRHGGVEHQRPGGVVQHGGGERAPLLDDRAALLGDPVEPVREPGAVAVGADRGHLAVHGAAVVAELHVAAFAFVRGTAPEVVLPDVRQRPGDALVPDVVVRPVERDQVAGQGAHRVQVGLGRLQHGGVGAVDVGEQLHGPEGDRDGAADGVDGLKCGHRSFQGAPVPSMRRANGLPGPIWPLVTRSPVKAEAYRAATNSIVRRASASVTGGASPRSSASSTAASWPRWPLGSVLSPPAVQRLATSSWPGAGVTVQSASVYPYRCSSSTVARSKSKRSTDVSRGDSSELTTEATAPLSKVTIAMETSSVWVSRACRTAWPLTSRQGPSTENSRS